MASKHNTTTNGLNIAPSHRPSVEVEFNTWAKPQLLQGEEFLMQQPAGWDMIQSFNNVWNIFVPQNRLPHPVVMTALE